MQRLLADVVRGAEREWPYAEREAVRDFIELAARHRVLPLASWRLSRWGAGRGWPAELLEAAHGRARQHALAEQVQRLELERVLRDLSAAGIRGLLFKGAALAYTHYVHPCHRPRTDVDLLIHDADVRRAIDVFRSRGYAAVSSTRGRLVAFQQAFTREERGGIRHAWDVHWRVVNRPAFDGVLEFEEMDADARPIPGLDGEARAPSPAHALLIACIHRVAHHHDAPMLIWIHDVHAITTAMSGREAERARILAEERGVAGICSASLALAQTTFQTDLPQPLRSMAPRRREPLAVFTSDRLRPVDILACDLRALPGWRDRVRLIGEHLFPPGDYLRSLEGRFGRAPLPVLYARRVVRGIGRWFKPAAGEF